MAHNGEDGINKFKSDRYDIVLMDIQMPGMDGYETTKKLRNWENQCGIQQTPVIAMTAHAYKEDIQRCIEAGCNAHIAKPVTKRSLLDTIHKHVNESNPERLRSERRSSGSATSSP